MGHKNDDNDGTFWMCWEDFRQVWMEITVCARSTNASDLSLDVHEDLGCPGEISDKPWGGRGGGDACVIWLSKRSFVHIFGLSLHCGAVMVNCDFA